MAQTPVTVALVIRNAADAMTFYTRAFGAVELYRLVDPSGKIAHAEMTIGGALIMIGEEAPEWGALAPNRPGGAGVVIHLQVPNVDAVVAAAELAGAKIVRPPADEFYGDRAARLEDPFGHVWQVATPIETVTPAEMQRRLNALYEG